MGCSCNKGIKQTSAQQVRRNNPKPVTRTVYKTPGNKKTIRRVLERY